MNDRYQADATLKTRLADGPPRVNYLDTLRFVAASAVLFQHACERRNPTLDSIVDMTSPGVFGVVLFFFISGFVMPMTAERRFSLPSFAIKRILRIYPLLIFALLLMALLNVLLGGALNPDAYTRSPMIWTANLLLVQDYVNAPAILGVTWTLSLEFAWYTLFAAIMYFYGYPNIRVLNLVAPVLLLALTVVSLFVDMRMPFGRIGLIYAAILGARGYQLMRGQISQSKFFRDAVIFEAVTLISNYVAFGHFHHPNISVWQAVVPWTMALAIFVTTCGVKTIHQSALMNAPPFLFLGRISYSLYLLHPIALGLAELWLGRELSSLFVGILLAFAMACFGYFLIEKPGQELVGRMTRRIGLATVRPAETAKHSADDSPPPLRP